MARPDCRKVAKVGQMDRVAGDLHGHGVDAVVRKHQELVEQPEFVHDLEGRGMDRVAAKIPQEVRVLFQHGHFHALPGEKQPQHHARRPAAGDAAAHGHCFIGHRHAPEAIPVN